MKRRSVLALGVLVIAAGMLALFALLRPVDSDALVTRQAEEEARASTPSPLPTADAVDGAAGRRGDPAGTAESDLAERESEASPASAGSERAVVQGRFVHPGGAPAPGVRLHLYGRSQDPERQAAHGRKVERVDFEAQTDEDGRFELRFDPPPPCEFRLKAELSGHSQLGWRWEAIAPGAVEDVGEVELVPGGVVVARALDAHDEPLRRGLYARIDLEDAPPHAEVGYVSPDAATGELRFEGVPAGVCQMHVYFRSSSWISGPRFELRAGETLHFDVPYAGPDVSRRIRVTTSCRFHTMEPAPEHMHVLGPDGERRDPTGYEAHMSHYDFDGLEPELYTVEIDDPRFLTWRQSGVRPGFEAVWAELEGSAALLLHVEDKASGLPIAEYSVNVELLGTYSLPSVFPVLEIGDPKPEAGRITGLLPVPSEAHVSAPGYAPATVGLDGLESGGTIERTVRLIRESRIAGKVLDADGRPAPKVVVGVFGTWNEGGVSATDRTAGLPHRPSWANAARSLAVTDADGAFRFDGLRPGSYLLKASTGSLLEVESQRFRVRKGESKDDLVLQLHAEHWIDALVLAPSGASFEGLELEAQAARAEPEPWAPGPPRAQAELDATGRCRLGPLPAGSFAVSLVLPEDMFSIGEDAVGLLSAMQLPIGEVQVAQRASTQVEFDLRDAFPGAIRVTVGSERSLPRGLVVQAARVGGVQTPDLARNTGSLHGELRSPSASLTEGEESEYSPFDSIDHGARGAPLGEDGTADVDPLFCGTWRVSVRCPEGGWIFEDPLLAEVRSGEQVEHFIDLRLHAASLLLLDLSSHAPLADAEVEWRHSSLSSGGWVPAQTDAEGRLELDLPPGTLSVRRGAPAAKDARAAPVEVAWTLEGPMPASLELP